jgi:uncharacterized membrane protein YfcA
LNVNGEFICGLCSDAGAKVDITLGKNDLNIVFPEPPVDFEANGGANVLLVFALVHIFGLTFLGAIANSKLPNLIITAASLPVFITAGYVDWAVAVPLTLSTAVGAALGASLAVNRENRTLRIVFRVLIGLLAIRYLF